MTRREYVKFTRLPQKLDDEKLQQVVQFLRDNGNVRFCDACKACQLNLNCEGHNCLSREKSVVNFIIETHTGLAIHIANGFKKYDSQELVAVALLSLTEAINRFEKLKDNNISAYATSWITFGIRRFLKRTPMIRVPNDTYLKTKQSFKINKINPVDSKIGKTHQFQLQVDVRATLESVAKTKHKKVIAECMLKGGFQNKEIAEMCGVSQARISQLSTEIKEEFTKLWKKDL